MRSPSVIWKVLMMRKVSATTPPPVKPTALATAEEKWTLDQRFDRGMMKAG